jgi:spore coat polysaccharide biosynthesis protein SpsF
MGEFTTEQERFWAGSFGKEYVERNRGDALLASNRELFSRILEAAGGVASLLELGANIGMNLRAISSIAPDTELTGVEINAEAAAQLAEIPGVEAINASMLEFEPPKQYELVLTKGTLIHINPDSLPAVYELMHAASSRYTCIAEYYSPTPVAIPYRGHEDRLFKRDFAGELLDRYPDLRLRDYGFVYHRDPEFPQDDLTWFLLERERG